MKFVEQARADTLISKNVRVQRAIKHIEYCIDAYIARVKFDTGYEYFPSWLVYGKLDKESCKQIEEHFEKFGYDISVDEEGFYVSWKKKNNNKK